MSFDNDIVTINEFYSKILISIDENCDDRDFLFNLFQSEILLGKYFPKRNKILQQSDVFFQAITLRFYSPSDSWTDTYKISSKITNDELKKYNLKREYWFENTGKSSRNLLKHFDEEIKKKIKENLKKNNYLDELLDFKESEVDNVDVFSWKEDYWKIFSIFWIFIFFQFLKKLHKKK